MLPKKLSWLARSTTSQLGPRRGSATDRSFLLGVHPRNLLSPGMQNSSQQSSCAGPFVRRSLCFCTESYRFRSNLHTYPIYPLSFGPTSLSGLTRARLVYAEGRSTKLLLLSKKTRTPVKVTSAGLATERPLELEEYIVFPTCSSFS